MSVPLKHLDRYLPSTFKKRYSIVARDKPVMVFPGVRADDPSYRRFIFDLFEELERRAPRSAVADGLYKAPGCPGGWEKLLNVPGYMMNPSGTPTGKQPDSVPTRWECDADRKLFSLIVRKLFPHGQPANFSSRRDSSTMHPYYTTDPAVKLKSLKAGLAVLSGPLWRAYEANTPELLAVEFGFWIKHDKATREQQDGAKLVRGVWHPKEREVTDFFGRRVIADKTLHLPGVSVPHWRSRGRIAYGTAASANYALVVLAAAMRAVSYKLYGFTYHHQGSEAMGEALAARPHLRFAVPLDVKNFDMHQPPFMIQEFIDNLPLSDTAKLLCRLVATAPVGANQDYLGESDYRSIGNPLDFTTFTLAHGNPSGWALNDLLNSAVGTFMCLRMAEESGAIQLRRDAHDLVEGVDMLLERVLRGEHPAFAFQNKGDDSVLWFAEQHHHAALLKALKGGTKVYLDVELEDGARFLGNVYVQDGARLAILPDITSYALRELNPEYSWGSKKRPFAGHGHFERQKYYGKHPLFEEVHRCIGEIFSKHYGLTLDALLEPHRVAPVGGELLNFAEAEFMVNPSSVHYKVDVADIRPELQEKFFVQVPWPDLHRHIRPHFTQFEG